MQRQRTVYRLTLVKQWNTDELDAYASLVSKGTPDFIEIKVIGSACEHPECSCRLSFDGFYVCISDDWCSHCCTFPILQGVTYCGNSKASSLTMSNVPWHEEVHICVCACVHTCVCVCDMHYTVQVLNFVQQFADMLPDYEIACEHEHSNCVLIAHKKVHSPLYYLPDISLCLPYMYISWGRCIIFSQFKVEGKWHTWIDFDKFIELVRVWVDLFLSKCTQR